MPRKYLQLIRAEMGPPSIFKNQGPVAFTDNFILAFQHCIQSSTGYLTFVFEDERGQEVRLTLHNTEYSNDVCFVSGTDPSSLDNSISIPSEPPRDTRNFRLPKPPPPPNE